MNKLIELMFKNRGYSDEFIIDIENSYYDELKDIDELCVELKEIHDEGKVITQYSDFDTDGICAGDVGFAGLAELGFKVNLYIPDTSKGYGILPEQVDDLLAKYPDTDVILTSDTGITAYEAALRCKARGVRMFITDHHKQQKSIDAEIVVNPMRLDESYSHPAICGAFVLWQVLARYAELYCNNFQQEQISRLRVFAGIGTVSDTMPVLYENRQLLRDAIDICQYVYGDGKPDAVDAIEGCLLYRRVFKGLYNIFKVYEESGAIKNATNIDEGFFGCTLAPALNSAKRLDKDMAIVFGIFFADNSYECAKQIYEWNIERKTLVAEELKRIDASKQPYAPYAYISTAKAGILGLLAMSLMNRTGVPTFVLIDEGPNCGLTNRYHGSGRSPEWYKCDEGLANVMTVSGHDFAFGCGVANETDLQRVYNILSKEVPPLFEEYGGLEETPDFVISTDLSGDTGIDIKLFSDFIEEVQHYRPFGKGFPEPNIKLHFNAKDAKWTVLKNGLHLKIFLPLNFNVLCWNQGHLIEQSKSFDSFDVWGKLEISEFNGERSVQFVGKLVEQK